MILCLMMDIFKTSIVLFIGVVYTTPRRQSRFRLLIQDIKYMITSLTKKIILLLLLGLTTNACFAITTSDKWSIDDSLEFSRVGRVVASPTGDQVTFVTMQIISENNTKVWRSTLYLKGRNGNLKVLSETDHNLSSPRWSPNGEKIAFLSQGDKFQSIWIVNIKTGKRKKIVEIHSDVISFKWSHDSKVLAFVADTQSYKKENSPKPIVVANDYVNARLFVVPVNFNNIDSTPRILTADTYSISIFDEYYGGGFDWSPDDKIIIFAYQPNPGAEYSNQSKLALVDIKTGKIKKIPYTNKHTGNQPLFSPNGKWVAFRSNLPPAKTAPKLRNETGIFSRICITEISTSKTQCLNSTFNKNPTILGWNGNSNALLVFDGYKVEGHTIFYELSIDQDKKAKRLSPTKDAGFVNFATVSLNQSRDVIGFAYETPSSPPQPYTSAVQSFKPELVSNVQKASAHSAGNVKTIHWKSTDGKEIEGLLITPLNYDKSKSYPLVTAIHGGPSGSFVKCYIGGCWGHGKHIVPICWGDLLSKGFIIFQPNYRGSDGYGPAFRWANFADFGGGDYQDIQTGIDYLVNQGIADPNHLAVFGWSYGGFMTSWLIGHTDRFKAAVMGDGNTDFISFSGTSDIPTTFTQTYFGKYLWEDPDMYIKFSPIFYVDRMKTPLLILQGQADTRVPPGQAYELYSALRVLHRPVQMLILPKQGHVPTDPNLIHDTTLQIEALLSKALK